MSCTGGRMGSFRRRVASWSLSLNDRFALQIGLRADLPESTTVEQTRRGAHPVQGTCHVQPVCHLSPKAFTATLFMLAGLGLFITC